MSKFQTVILHCYVTKFLCLTIGVESFIVRVVRKEDVENPEIQLESDGLRLTVQNLASGTEYDVFVTSVGEENQRSEESDVASVTTSKKRPRSPDNECYLNFSSCLLT